MRRNNAGDRIIIVHDTDGGMRAFCDTCRHCGAPAVTRVFRYPASPCKTAGALTRRRAA